MGEVETVTRRELISTLATLDLHIRLSQAVIYLLTCLSPSTRAGRQREKRQEGREGRRGGGKGARRKGEIKDLFCLIEMESAQGGGAGYETHTFVNTQKEKNNRCAGRFAVPFITAPLMSTASPEVQMPYLGWPAGIRPMLQSLQEPGDGALVKVIGCVLFLAAGECGHLWVNPGIQIM